jgi:hypothetical protein
MNQNDHLSTDIGSAALRLVKADALQVRKLWKYVRTGCAIVKTKTERLGDDVGWTPEHVRFQLDLHFENRSTCELWLIQDGEAYVRGFLVTLIGMSPYLQIPESLLVWVAYTDKPIGGRNAQAIVKQVEDYAQCRGVKYVDGYTNRNEWGSWLTRYGRGYRSVMTLIRKELWE